eukprot:5984451-Pyramimonas_sp.AAC.1
MDVGPGDDGPPESIRTGSAPLAPGGGVESRIPPLAVAAPGSIVQSAEVPRARHRSLGRAASRSDHLAWRRMGHHFPRACPTPTSRSNMVIRTVGGSVCGG